MGVNLLFCFGKLRADVFPIGDEKVDARADLRDTAHQFENKLTNGDLDWTRLVQVAFVAGRD